jgi:type IV pilus assembly protein PilP
MRAVTLLFIVAALPALAAAQPPAAPGVPAAEATPPGQKPAPPAPPPPPENYSYQPAGRRDPFTSLVGAGPGTDSGMGLRRGEGAAGIAVEELTVRGVMQSRNGMTAMIQGPDKKTYVVHVGDKLADGVIKAVTLQGLVIVQEVNDPLSLVKQREVTKRLRSLEDAKQ